MLNPRKTTLGPSGWLFLSGLAAVAMLGCVPRQQSSGAPPPSPAAAQQAAGDVELPPPPPPPPAAPEPAVKQTGNVYTDRFLELWTDIHKMQNGYFSAEGIPYHAIETMVIEAPDHGHETTSEAYSYWIWLEAMYGKVTKDWSHLDRAWKNMEYYMIPTRLDQPTNHAYGPTKPATYAEERDLPSQYPVPLVGSVKVGTDPIGAELRATYNNPDIYAMHWQLDVDNWYGFGKRGDGKSRASYFNTFQRGPQESVWETIPQPCWEDFSWGGPNGYLDLFGTQPSYARQWKYSNAPDADARAVQAAYWAKKWADEQGGGNSVVEEVVQKAAKMGDFVRYSFFDKYFKPLGCKSPDCPVSDGYQSAHYLISWYFAWGGSIPGGGAWAWRIGSSHNHAGYQNLVAAHALSQEAAMKPKSPNGAKDWGMSLTRMLEFYRWLQSAEGGIAGGATNSWKGRYEQAPAGVPTFYGMSYDPSPVFQDPPSNDWFGFQVWSLQRVAEYYYITGDPKAKVIIERWVKWAKDNTELLPDGGYKIPSTMKWSGQPGSNWDAQNQNFDPADQNYNSGLQVEIVNKTEDVGTTAGLVHTLTFYAAKANDKDVQNLAKQLLDRMWTKFRDDKGLTTPETLTSFKRFNEKVFVPPNWKGKMPSGDPIEPGATFLSLRTKYKQDPDWPKVEAYLNGGPPPEFRYHRFWAQAHFALAYATYGWLFPEKTTEKAPAKG